MKKVYEQATIRLIALEEDVIMVSGTGQLSYESDNVIAWWGMEVKD